MSPRSLRNPLKLLASTLTGLILAFSLPAAAEDSIAAAERIGYIERVVGKASIERAGKTEPVRTQAAIVPRDRFSTERGAHLLLIMSDASQIWLGENGELTIIEYH